MCQARWSQNYGTYVISSTFLKTQTAPFKNPKVYASYSVPTWHLRSTADRINTSILRGRYSTVRFPHPFKFIIFIRLSGVEIWPQLRCRHVARRILRGKGLWCFRSQEAQLLAPQCIYRLVRSWCMFYVVCPAADSMVLDPCSEFFCRSACSKLFYQNVLF